MNATDQPCNLKTQLLLTAAHRDMIAWLKRRLLRRSANDVIRYAVERVYQTEKLAEQRQEAAAAQAAGRSTVGGRS
jgi:Arc/MetJ-type ribon-helix-helix transcriptional regulator